MVRYWLSGVLLSLASAAALAGDPTKPQTGGVSADTEMRSANQRQVLTAIFIKGKKRSAVINGQLYHQGDWIGDKQLVAVDSTGVSLANGESRIRLVLIQKIRK